jgi:hypothetical protein
MEARTRGDIEVEVSMMHPMHPPKRGHRVEHYVLKVNRKVEHDHRGSDRDCKRYRRIVKQAPASPFPGESQTHGRRREQDLASTVFSATTARLLGQRLSLEYDLARRCATAAHSAIVVKTAMNAPRRMAARSELLRSQERVDHCGARPDSLSQC